MLQIWKILFSLNPCGCNDFSFSIQNFFRVFSTYFSSSYSILVSFSCSIIINCECLMNLWPGNRKCCSSWSDLCLFTSFQWLFRLKLKVVSDLPVFCLLQNTHSIRSIRYLLSQLSLMHILKALCVTVLLKVFFDCTCVQHRFFGWLRITILINTLTYFFSIVDDWFLAKNILQVSVSSEDYYREFCNHCLFLIYPNAYLLLFYV